MKKITLETLNNLLQPVNMRCASLLNRYFYIQYKVKYNEFDFVQDENDNVLTPKHLGFEIIEDSEK